MAPKMYCCCVPRFALERKSEVSLAPRQTGRSDSRFKQRAALWSWQTVYV